MYVSFQFIELVFLVKIFYSIRRSPTVNGGLTAKYITDHLYTEFRSRILLILILGEKRGFKITGKIILSFIGTVPLSVTVKYRWRTIKTGLSFVKGDRDCLR